MNKRTNKEIDSLQEVINLMEKIDKYDPEDSGGHRLTMPSPYSGAKTPKPARWKNKGLQNKLL